jgi:hypothetical protein
MLALVIVAAAELVLGAGGDLPPLGISRSLPSRQHALAQVAFVSKWHEYHPGAPMDWDYGRWCWETVALIQQPGLGPLARREKIKELVDWLGWEAVLTGNFPPSVPLGWISAYP